MQFVIATDPSESSKAGPKQRYAYQVTVIARVPFGLPGDEDTLLDGAESDRTSCYLVSFGPQAEFRVIPVWCLIELKKGQQLWVIQDGYGVTTWVRCKNAATGKLKSFRVTKKMNWDKFSWPTAFVEGADGEIVRVWL